MTIRDIQPIWGVVTRLFFFLTPSSIRSRCVPPNLQHILMLNPLAVVIEQARHALIDPAAPTAAQAAGGTLRLVIPIGFSVALFIGSCSTNHARSGSSSDSSSITWSRSAATTPSGGSTRRSANSR